MHVEDEPVVVRVVCLAMSTDHHHYLSIPIHPEKRGWKNWVDGRVCQPAIVRRTDAAIWSATCMELYIGGRTAAC